MGPTIFAWGVSGNYINYRRAMADGGGRLLVSGELEAADRCDGLLLPGGGDLEPWRYGEKNLASRGLDPARDAAELELLARFTTLRKPVLGICRGLQTINVFFGGTLCQDLPGHSAAAGIDRLHTVKTAPGLLAELYGGSCIVNSAHHQAADRLGGGLRAAQWAPDGIVEALCHETLPVWAVQWHPERLSGITDGGRLIRTFLTVCW